jgi:glycosyltransferase A (GT-A) superfamily protein (DUF2064 family)
VSAGRALVLAKAPVPGRVKTRLGAVVGAELAATLAASALLDTVLACSAAFDECHLALDGELAGAVEGAALAEATADWNVFGQCDGGLGARLADAHRRASGSGGGPVVQIGMDTPQVTAGQLRAVARDAVPGAAVLGPARDGGWWVLALTAAAGAESLAGVPMSTPATHDLTRAALRGAGLRVHPTVPLRDIDTVADAAAVAAAAPHTRFAEVWRRAGEAA